MLPNLVAVANGKGGVGKTSLVANLSAVMAAARWRVLAVDLDPQGNLAQDFGAATRTDNDAGDSLGSVLAGDDAALRVCRDVRPGLDMVCGGPRIAEAGLGGGGGAPLDGGQRLTRALNAVAGDYNLIVVDCPPTIGEITYCALAAAAGVVIPVRGDDCSISGLSLVASQWAAVQQADNPHLRLLGVALNQIPASATRLQRELRTRIRAAADVHIFDTVIRESSRSAFDSRCLGVVAAEYSSRAANGRDDRFAALREGRDCGAWSHAADQLAADYYLLSHEIVTRLAETNRAATTHA